MIQANYQSPLYQNNHVVAFKLLKWLNFLFHASYPLMTLLSKKFCASTYCETWQYTSNSENIDQ